MIALRINTINHCKEDGCCGQIDFNARIYLKATIDGLDFFPLVCFLCNQCGRLHNVEGALIFDANNNKIFFDDNLGLVARDENNELVMLL